MDNNVLFFTNNVRNYIRELYHNKNLLTTAISYTFYKELCQFINFIKKFEVVDRKKTIKKLLLYISCNGDIQNRENTFNLFIENLKNIDIEESIKKIILDIKDELLININKNSTKEECKNDINEILNKYFKSLKFKQSDIKEHNIIKNIINNFNTEDIELFMNFFNYVECIDEQCDNYKITDKNNPKSKLNLIKNEKGKILLLELFNGIDVQLILSPEDESKFNKIESELDKVFDNELKKVCDEYAQKFEEEYNKKNVNSTIIKQEGGCNPTGLCMEYVVLLGISYNINNYIHKILKNIGLDILLNNVLGKIILFFSSSYLTYYIFIVLPEIMYNYENKLNYIESKNNKNKKKEKELEIFIYRSIKNILLATTIAVLLYFSIQMDIYDKKYKKNNNLYGGGNKCYIIPNLKINLVNKFLIFTTENNDINIIEKCDQIKLGNKKYLLSGYSDNNSIDCLNTTNLFKNNKINGGKKYKIIKLLL